MARRTALRAVTAYFNNLFAEGGVITFDIRGIICKFVD